MNLQRTPSKEYTEVLTLIYFIENLSHYSYSGTNTNDITQLFHKYVQDVFYVFHVNHSFNIVMSGNGEKNIL